MSDNLPYLVVILLLMIALVLVTLNQHRDRDLIAHALDKFRAGEMGYVDAALNVLAARHGIKRDRLP